MPPPVPSGGPGQLGFGFDRSGYRVPAIIVSPWVPARAVFSDEYRHTSMIATLRKVWGLGDPFSARDAAARTFEGLLSLESPREPGSWPDVTPLPVPGYREDRVAVGQAVSTLGRHLCHALLQHVRETGGTAPAAPDDPDDVSPTLALDIVHRLAADFFPHLATAAPTQT